MAVEIIDYNYEGPEFKRHHSHSDGQKPIRIAESFVPIFKFIG